MMVFGRSDDNQWAARWLSARLERLSSERRREIMEAATARGRLASGNVFSRLRRNAWSVVQAAVAAALAWLIATRGLGHQSPFFAPISAIYALSATRGQRMRRAIELIVGVAIGITAGDLLRAAIGVGVWQLAVIVALAMASAIAFGAGMVALSEAGVSATLVATLAPTTQGFPPSRLTDVLVGGAVALVFSQVLFPLHPVKLVRQAAESVVRELAATLGAIADAMEHDDREEAASAQLQAREISAIWSRFEQALNMGREAAHYAPGRRHHRERFRVYRNIGLPLDLLVTDVSVLARLTVRALAIGDPVPSELPEALRDLAQATDVLAKHIGETEERYEIRSTVLRATYAATTLAPSDQNMSLSALVVYTQAAAADLLRVLGIDRDPAHDEVGRAAQAALSSNPG